ncbi:MAG: hypothetical protein WAM42_15165 [Candidatus Nitrosopolaris sp.]|jgi:high-affinity nickel-transport protein
MQKRARWVVTGPSIGHTVSIFGELVIYIIGSATNGIAFWGGIIGGGIIGAIALATIGVIDIYSMKRLGGESQLFLQVKW